MKLTRAQARALRWFADHGGDGLRTRYGTIIAAGEESPMTNMTWTTLGKLGLVERYGEKGRRVRMLPAGAVALAESTETFEDWELLGVEAAREEAE